jgi:phosphatidylinositol alpha 1,6-mannosyltransferase
MPPRVAYFPDSFHEVNGVAHTSRNFAAFARRREIPCSASARERRHGFAHQKAPCRRWSWDASPLAVQLERDLYFDPLFFRYSGLISETVRAFRPEIIHITGPSELGIFGAYFAWKLKVPLVASWHTNVHEYAARRMGWLTRPMGTVGSRIESAVESVLLTATSRFYGMAKVLYAPNPELCALLASKTGRPVHLMQRGVETGIFAPQQRTREACDGRIVFGYVGRLSVEKNVALLPRVDKELRARGIVAEWMIVGHGAEDEMLRRGLPGAKLVGVLRGEALSEAYANMDVLVFPSHTDTFGNVVLEALASGVPAVVTPDGGPASIVQDGVTGRVAKDEEFSAEIAEMLALPESFRAMRVAARRYAMQCSWDAVFERVVAAYPMTS